MNRTIGLLMGILSTVMLGGCDLVSQFPVITTFPPNFRADDDDKVFSATITQSNEPIDPILRVRCEVFFKTPPNQIPTIRSIDAERLAGAVYSCTLPEDIALRNNNVMVFEWLVETTNDQGTIVPVARSGQKTFHVGCSDPVGFLRAEQASVMGRFGNLTTIDQIVGAGFLPTHPTSVSLGALGSLPTNKVFKGMGVAFARVQDVPAAGGFAPFGAPTQGDPNLLLFRPSATAAGHADLADPFATFTLIGWAYATTIGDDFPDDHPPSTACFPLHEWFFHEEGHHTPDGGFTPGPPLSAIGVYHGRVWDLHVWATPSGVAALGIVNVTGAGGATTPSDGFEASSNSFFYPTFVDPLS